MLIHVYCFEFFFRCKFYLLFVGFFTLKGKEAENTSLREERIANIMKTIRDRSFGQIYWKYNSEVQHMLNIKVASL